MSKLNVARGLHLTHKGCLTGRFLMETELYLPHSVLHMALKVQSGALETEYVKEVQEKEVRDIITWFVELQKLLGSHDGLTSSKKSLVLRLDFALRPDVIAVKGNMAAIIDTAIIGDLLSLERVYRAKNFKYNKSLVRRSLNSKRMTYDFIPYIGKCKPVDDPSVPDLKQCANIVLHLAQTIPTNINHLLFFKNWGIKWREFIVSQDIPRREESKRGGKMVLCGHNLFNALRVACSSIRGKRSVDGFSEEMMGMSNLRSNMKKRAGLTDQCCAQPCSFTTLLSFC
ncbi:unnamed protein product [Lepeophtheirus salmonis]|uniref:(salmon louse) hypothetical protein n=1 Tax=Lepeophtheirus salmonis TaxID=72036 RepID=A0A7R8D558_LEPSM|nr:unnamed protein product [Lepeophtheirus salmonis]CAF3031848.1 unnamed protein product [Lepeophtheirus salmonis]